jgi:hypothetical protein
MERELWKSVYRFVSQVGAKSHQKYKQIPSWMILATMLWAALHDRPVSWACDCANWATTKLRPPRLPSAATMSRRVDGVAVGLVWRAVQERMRAAGVPASLLTILDGKALPVGGCTKDPDARYGRGAGTMAKGYKLHTIWSANGMPEAWEVTPLNAAETTVARRLIAQLHGAGYLTADGNYDVNELFDLAWERGYQLVTPPPKAPPGRRRHRPQRLRITELMAHPRGQDLYRLRIGISEALGNASSHGGRRPRPRPDAVAKARSVCEALS